MRRGFVTFVLLLVLLPMLAATADKVAAENRLSGKRMALLAEQIALDNAEKDMHTTFWDVARRSANATLGQSPDARDKQLAEDLEDWKRYMENAYRAYNTTIEAGVLNVTYWKDWEMGSRIGDVVTCFNASAPDSRTVFIADKRGEWSRERVGVRIRTAIGGSQSTSLITEGEYAEY